MAASESMMRFERSSPISTQSFETARRALFSAAARVMCYHAEALDAKLARTNQSVTVAAKELASKEDDKV